MSAPSESTAPSADVPPPDTRAPASRLEHVQSSAVEGLSESFQSTDTIRRRPDMTHGTVSSSYFADTNSPVQERPSSHRQSSASASMATRSPLLGPDRGRGRPRRPPLSRRTSSITQGRHRGGVFSVDDAPSEVMADEAEWQSSYSQGGGTRRRAPPTPSLGRLPASPDVEDDDDDDDDALPRTPRAPKTQGTPRVEAPDAGLQDDDIERLDALDDMDGGEGGGAGEGAGDGEDSNNHEAVHEDDNGHSGGDSGNGEDDEGNVSDAESFTLKDRQQAINETHPFGIRLWKPALYKKDRSVQKTAEGDIHSSPGGHVSNWLLFFNIMWTLFFGWWLALIAFTGAVVCLLFAAVPSGREYGSVLRGLSGYLLYPFGKFVRLEQQEPYLDEDQGEGRSISEYEQWQNGDLEYGRLFFGPESSRSVVGRSRRSIDSDADETDALLDRRSAGQTGGYGIHEPRVHSRHPDDDDDSDGDLPRMKRRLFGRGQWNVGRVIFFLFFYLLLTPSLFVVSGICWLLVFWIPMGRVTILLVDHLRRHPLALSFESDIASARAPAAPQSSIIVCTYRAVGLKYWKYTVDGTNIFLINLMAVVIFVIFDWLVLDRILELDNVLTSSAFLFVAGLLSIIPLAYFIGQAVASISAQSSMGVGAAINAFFSTVVEVFLYCVALQQGKAQLVEGSIIGSIFAGVLFLPGLSMCFGAIKRKTQRFNARSAGVTSTMLLFAVIGAFSPTLFYQIYGTHELSCLDCLETTSPHLGGDERDCRRCYFSQTPAIDDRFYIEAVRPYCYVAASTLFLAYVIGLWFTLRTHAAVIWNTEVEEKRHEEPPAHQHPHPQQQLPALINPPPTVRHTAVASGVASGGEADIRDSHLYRRILGQSLKQVGLPPREGSIASKTSTAEADSQPVRFAGLSEADSGTFVRQVAEMAAMAAALAARDVRSARRPSAPAGAVSTGGGSLGRGDGMITVAGGSINGPKTPVRPAVVPEHEETAAAAAAATGDHGGHDAPNWSRLKSSVILMCATALYAVIAEILVDSVDFVLDGFSIDEKFLGITLFALVPNTTEFLNAISFAMNGNIALSMEIGSAYALQVCLLQIPALVLFSAVCPPTVGADVAARYMFSLLFPQWDMVSVILCVFMLSYMYGEGKSNYFKGSILLLSYLVVIAGFYFSGYTAMMDAAVDSSGGGFGLRRFDTLGPNGRFVRPAPAIPRY